MVIRYNLEGEDVTSFFMQSHFPAGEMNIAISELEAERLPRNDIYFIDESLDVMAIGMKVDILRKADCSGISLVLPYLPYSRQDRHTVKGASFALKVFAKFINSLGFNKVYTVDAHSDVSGVIDNLVDLSVSTALDQIIRDIGLMPILSPDAGANKKIYGTVGKSQHKGALALETASKHRNPATGEINGVSSPVINGPSVLVFDDICDGGRTFVELAKVLPDTLTKYLYVTHGIFSKPDVFKFYDTVYSCNTIESQNTSENHIILDVKYSKRRVR